MAEGSSDTQFWLVSLPLEARNRGRDGGEQVLGTLQEKCGDLATTHKVGGPYACVCLSAVVLGTVPVVSAPRAATLNYRATPLFSAVLAA